MAMHFRLRMQLLEVLSPENRWFCSLAHHRKIDEPELLWIHFVRSGGAVDFARRFQEAMSSDNRWYCAQFYDREIKDEQMLWDYYMKNRRKRESAA